MAPTNIGREGDGSPRFDLGGHQNFMESSRALIKNTNSRIERMNAMSSHLRYLASQIKDDRESGESIQLTPEIVRINDSKTSGKALLHLEQRQSINIVIPFESQEDETQDKETKPQKNIKSKQGNSSHRKKSTGKKLKDLIKLSAGSDSRVKTPGNMKSRSSLNDKFSNRDSQDTKLPTLGKRSNTSIPKLEVKNAEKRVEETTSSENKITSLVSVNHGSENPSGLSKFHKFSDCKTKEEQMKTVKLFERLKFAKIAGSSQTQLKASIIQLSLSSRAKSQYIPRNCVSSSFHNESYTCSTDYPKGSFKIGQLENKCPYRPVLLPTKITLQAKNMCELFSEGSVSQLEEQFVGFRFRIGQKSNELSKSDSCHSDKSRYSTAVSNFMLKSSVS